MSEFEANNQLTLYKGEICTVAQRKARKAAETRKKIKEEFLSETQVIMSSIKDICLQIKKSSKMLKSIRAFHRNGESQWHNSYKEFLNTFPDISKNILRFSLKFDETECSKKELSKIFKGDRYRKRTSDYIDKFGYQMLDLMDILEELSDAISNAKLNSNPCWRTHEIYCGASTGKRVGLKKIQSQFTSTVNNMKKSLIELSRLSTECYKIANFQTIS